MGLGCSRGSKKAANGARDESGANEVSLSSASLMYSAPIPKLEEVSFEKLINETQESEFSVIKEQFVKEPDKFLLNQLLLSTQFLKNFDKDKVGVRVTRKETEEDMNSALASIKQRSMVIDAIFYRILDNVGLRTREHQQVLEPLAPTEYYVVNVCFETNDEQDYEHLVHDSMDYASLEKPHYRVCVAPSSNSGYARVHCIDSFDQMVSLSQSNALSYTVGTPMSMLKNPLGVDLLRELGSRSGLSSKRTSYVSMVMEEDNYGYVTRKPRPLPDNSPSNVFSNTLPIVCFIRINVEQLDKKKEMDELDNEVDPYPDTDNSFMDSDTLSTYVSSKYFLANFVNQFGALLNLLGREQWRSSARLLEPRIMCRVEDNQDDDQDVVRERQFDFIPCLEVNFWPTEGIEWFRGRSRPKVQDRRTGLIYQWPSNQLVSQAQQIGCHAVPIGHLRPTKSKSNNQSSKKASSSSSSSSSLSSTVEWELRFARAESLIQQELSHAQLRCLFFMLCLSKTCVNDSNDQDFNVEHIKFLLYWSVERSPTGWTEDRLGERLLQMVREAESCVKKERLNHYFLYKRNVFDSIPRHRLLRIQQKLFRILENPVPHLLKMLKRLHVDTDSKHVLKKSFYPLPDVERLVSILTTEHTLTLINPALLAIHESEGRSKPSSRPTRGPEDRGVARMREHRRRMEEQRSGPQASSADVKENDDDNIDLDMKINSSLVEDPRRGALILEFFIQHFVNMAKKSQEFKAFGQALMYTCHSENLLRLLDDHGSLSLDVGHVRGELRQMRRHLSSKNHLIDAWRVNWDHEELRQLIATNETPKRPLGVIRKVSSRLIGMPLPKPPQQAEVQVHAHAH